MVSVAFAVECGSEPVPGCDVTVNTTFYPTILYCDGEPYCVNIQGDDTYLDCNGSTLVLGDSWTVLMDVSGGVKSYLRNCIINFSVEGIHLDHATAEIDNIILNKVSGSGTEGVGIFIDANNDFESVLIHNTTITSKQGIDLCERCTLGLYDSTIYTTGETGDAIVPTVGIDRINLTISNSFLYEGDGVAEHEFTIENCSDSTFYFDFSIIDSYFNISESSIIYTEVAGCELIPVVHLPYAPTYTAYDIPLITGDVIGTAGVEVRNWIPTYFVSFMLILLILFIMWARKKLS